MRQVWITKAGPPEVLQIREVPEPSAAPGEIKIRVRYAGVNFADIMARLGLYPDAPPIPCVVGYEVAGEVVEVGEGVATFHAGDRVVSFTRFMGYSEYVTVPVAYAARVPATIPLERAAALPVNYATAWLMLVYCGNVRAGDTVLVHAAAGGVGLAALQICRWRGATVIGTASASKHAALKELGIAHVIDYTREDFESAVKQLTQGRGVDIVLDAVGGQSFRKSYRCLAPLGRLFVFGSSSLVSGERRSLTALIKTLVATPFFHPFSLTDKNRGVYGINLGHLWEEFERLRPSFQEIITLAENGTFSPIISQVFPCERAADAHRFIQDRKNFGKVLLHFE
jgi:NADPH:quinone reductase-like Zn-dependent oxidoreductase